MQISFSLLFPEIFITYPHIIQLANMQPMATDCDPIFASCRFGLRNAPLQRTKQAVLQAKTACFANPNGTFHNTLIAKWLHKSMFTMAFNTIKVNLSMWASRCRKNRLTVSYACNAGKNTKWRKTGRERNRPARQTPRLRKSPRQGNGGNMERTRCRINAFAATPPIICA